LKNCNDLLKSFQNEKVDYLDPEVVSKEFTELQLMNSALKTKCTNLERQLEFYRRNEISAMEDKAENVPNTEDKNEQK
jgi:hypothetical protein